MKLWKNKELHITDKIIMTKEINCEVYSRVVGYYRPTSTWNKGKLQEYKERVTFKEA